MLFYSGLRELSIQRNARNVHNATQGTDATTGEASDRAFDTPSFIVNIKLLDVCLLLNIALIVVYFCSFTSFVAGD